MWSTEQSTCLNDGACAIDMDGYTMFHVEHSIHDANKKYKQRTFMNSDACEVDNESLGRKEEKKIGSFSYFHIAL